MKTDTNKQWRRAIVYMVWGEKYIRQACESARSASFMGIPLILITDEEGREILPCDHPFDHLKFVEKFRSYDMRMKSTLYDNLPTEFDSFLYLDSDTQVLKDITFGFEKAERHGIALCPATSYCLPSHHQFRRIMTANGLPDAGQMQYNAGVYFFVRRPDVADVFELFQKSTYDLTDEFDYKNARGKLVDQPFLSYAMELHDFNPYTLTISYCYRSIDAEPICGGVFIWHSHYPVPENINSPENYATKRPRYFMGVQVDMSGIYGQIRSSLKARDA